MDGGVSNPVPVSLARALGAERVISVDLNTVTQTLKRFDRPTTTAVVPAESSDDNGEGLLAPISKAITDVQKDIERRMALAKARHFAQPQLFETVAATIDIIQRQLAQARAQVDVADVRLTPDLSCATAAAFDHHEEFEEIGYQCAMHAKNDILSIAYNTRHPSEKELMS